MMKRIIIAQIILVSFFPLFLNAQDKPFSLEACINYALENSTDIIRANNNVKMQNANLIQSKAARGPNLFFNSNPSFSSTNSYQNNESDGIWANNTNFNLSISLSSEMTLYNGAKLKNTIAQGKTKLQAYESDIQIQKELISFNLLYSYINSLLAIENVKNSKAQLKLTEKQLELAEARKSAGIISTSNFLNIKSQYASDKARFIDSENTLRLNLVYLMQLMNMPIIDSFTIQEPNIDSLINKAPETNASLIYNIALGIQPSIKSATLNLESSQIEIKIAKADALPKLSFGGSIGTGYNTNIPNVNFGEQFYNKINPFIGLSLSVPIYQQKKVKTNIAIANIQFQNEELTFIDLKNNLRKYIEQACLDAQTAKSNYLALQEQYDAISESYQLSEEMFKQGLINSVDFLTSKNNLITAENTLTQAKYNVLLQNKIIDYYIGNPILF